MDHTTTNAWPLWIRIGTAALIALAGALLFQALHLPVPWLLGPMLASLVASNLLKKRHYAWPSPLRNGALIVIGYTIGLALTGEALRRMGTQVPYMILMTFLLLLLCAGISFVIGKLSGTDFKTSLLGSVPGGLSQIVVLAEETKGVDLTLVTVNQVIRLLLIVIGIPLLIYSPLFGQQAGDAAQVAAAPIPWSGLFPNVFVYGPLCVALALLGKKVRFPTAFLLCPAFGTALLQATGFHAPELPHALTAAAQLALGTYVGTLLRPAQIEHKFRTLSLSLLSGLLLIVGSFGLTVLLTYLQPVTPPTALLSLAPGGMDQMGIIAHSIGADLSIVSGYQLFRTFFIFFAIPPLLRMLFRYTDRQPEESRRAAP